MQAVLPMNECLLGGWVENPGGRLLYIRRKHHDIWHLFSRVFKRSSGQVSLDDAAICFILFQGNDASC